MRYNKLLVLVCGLLAFGTLTSGIIRHRVSETKYLKLAQQQKFDCVGQIYSDTTARGSCVLISDRYVLSAAHVFLENDTRLDTIRMSGQMIVAYTPINVRESNVTTLSVVLRGKSYRVRRLLLHPAYRDSLTKGTCDVALLELEQPVTSIIPASPNTLFDELRSEVVGVGYGASGPADRPDLIGFLNKKIAGENVVDSVGGVEHRGHSTLMFCDFDHPSRTDCNKMGSSTPRPLEYVCSGGDSGGGLFRMKNGRWELIGICSGSNDNVEQLNKSGYYGMTMQWTRVSAFTEWINKHTR
jgi:secreted trypsin-like serine protease